MKSPAALFLSLSLLSVSLPSSGSNRAFHAFDFSILLKRSRLANESANANAASARPIFTSENAVVDALPPLVDIVEQQKIMQVLATAVPAHPIPPRTSFRFPTAFVVVGFRLDPCGKALRGSFNACIPQLRIVAQDPSVQDASVHLIYDLSVVDFQTMLARVSELNDQCGLLVPPFSLKPHPCSERPEFLAAWNSLLTRYTGAKYLSKLAYQVRLGEDSERVAWRFVSIARSAPQGQWVLLATPWAPLGEEAFQFGRGKEVFEQIQLNGLDHNVIAGLQGQLSAKAMAKLVSKLNDPFDRHVRNTSCFSCHAVPSLQARVPILRGQNISYYQENELEKSDSPNAGFAFIRHFGYSFGQAQISTRVQIETEAIVKKMNQGGTSLSVFGVGVHSNGSQLSQH